MPVGGRTRFATRARRDDTRSARKVRPSSVLFQPEEVAEAVMMFVEDETMAGRVMIWQEG